MTDIIVTHELADFDALASAVAAQKLYPGAEIVLLRRLSPAVRSFVALHRDRFRTRRFDSIDFGQVSRLVLVDVRRASRLAPINELVVRAQRRDPTLEVHIYDHHAAHDDDLVGSGGCIEPVGSTTTLLIEIMRERGLAVDPVEATLLALGIHTDTGSLSFSSTTSRDCSALAWLLDSGASLAVVNRYLTPRFSHSQRELLSRTLGAVEVESFGGVDVGLAVVQLDRAEPGFGEVTSEAARLEGLPALIALYAIGDRQVQVIARSSADFIDVGQLLCSLGGGGHPAAAAAIVKQRSVDDLREELVARLRNDPPRPRRVRDLMSSPVRSVPPDTTLRGLGESLRSWRHTGMPVVRDGELVGIVSRRDVESAARDGRLHLKVSSAMTHEVKTTTPDSTLEDALEAMVRANVGRLPVLRGGELVGIVTRSDVLRAIYSPKEG